MVFHKVLHWALFFLILILIFNIDLFLLDYKCDIASYADDNTPYTSDISLNLVLEKLESSTNDLFGLRMV